MNLITLKIRQYKFSIMLFALFLVSSCETTQLEILDDPNAVVPDQSDINFFLNSIQFATISMLEGTPLDNQELNEVGMEVIRMTHMFGPTYLVGTYASK